MPLSTITLYQKYQKYILTPTVYVEVGQASPPPTDLLQRPSAPPGNAQTRFLKKNKIYVIWLNLCFSTWRWQMWQLLIGFVGKQGHLSRISYYDIGFPISPARFEGATAVVGWSGSSQWIHHFNDGEYFASLSPLCWSETPNSMCFKNGWHLQWWENQRFMLFQIMLSQAPRAPTRLWPTWRVTAETCWAIEPTIHQYE